RRRPTAAALAVVSGLSALALLLGGVAYSVQLRAAEAEARRQRGRADDRYRKAKAALQRILDRLNQKRANVPGLQALRQAQMEEALAFYLDVAGEQEAPDPAVRDDVALTSYQAATLQLELGRHAPAEENLRRAIGLLERLAAERPDVADYRQRLAYCW